MTQKIREMLYSSKYTIRERFFMLSSLVGAVATFVVLIVNIVTGQSKVMIGGILIAFAVFMFGMWQMFRTRNYVLFGSILMFLAVVVFLPFGYLAGGGIDSGSPVWLMIYFMLAFMIYKGKTLWFFVLLITLTAGVSTWIGAMYPDIVIPIKGSYGQYVDSYLSVVSVGVILGGMILLQRRLLDRENTVAKEQKKEIEQLNESQNRFFSSMSHEIRTPINTIIGLNELTLRERDLPEEIVENAQNIQGASKMLLSLINDILDLSKIQSGRMEVVESRYETAAMLSDIVNLLWNRAREKGLRFDINVGETVPSMLFGDEMRIKQVIINLLTNAIKYTAEGTVTLSVDGEQTDMNAFTLKIEVNDTGVGIRKENLPQLFQTFKRVDEHDTQAIEGTGLGLSISKQLVELMHGTISVDSIYTKGSTFRVEIPQRIVDGAPVNYRHIRSTHTAGSYVQSFEAPGAKILIVDDNEMNRMVAGKLLRATQVQVEYAASGQECLVKTRETRFDAIFMDHEMPEMDGVETLRRVRAQENGLCRETPVIALTANAGSDMSKFYLEQGFQAYIAKPIHSSLLEATLMQVLQPELIDRTTQEHADEEQLFVAHARKKRGLIITTDCACDLPQSMLDEYGIRMMHYYCATDEGRFRDLTEIDADNLLQYIADNEGKVSTSPAPVQEYEHFFGEMLSRAEAVIHVSLGSHYDSGYENALHAAESFGNVHVFDSGTVSGALGLLVYRAAEYASGGRSVQEVEAFLAKNAPRVHAGFLASNPGLMARRYRGGRLVKGIAEVFRFEPSFLVRKGKIRLDRFYTGYFSDNVEQYIRSALHNLRGADESLLLIAHSGCSTSQREKILALVNKYGHFDRIVMQKASATISANCGPRSFGLFYMR